MKFALPLDARELENGTSIADSGLSQTAMTLCQLCPVKAGTHDRWVKACMVCSRYRVECVLEPCLGSKLSDFVPGSGCDNQLEFGSDNDSDNQPDSMMTTATTACFTATTALLP